METPKPQLFEAIQKCGCDNCLMVCLQAAEAGGGMYLIQQTIDDEWCQIPLFEQNRSLYGMAIVKGVAHHYTPKETQQAAQRLNANSKGYTLQ